MRMTFERDFQSKLPVISAIPKNQLKTPIQPVMEYVGEADRLQERCEQDKPELIAAGLDWDIVADLSVRAGAYYKTECDFEYIGKLQETIVRAASHLDTLLPMFHRAYSSNPYLLARINCIDSYRHINEAQALMDLMDLALAYREGLDKNFNLKNWFSEADYLKLEHNFLTKKVGDKDQQTRTRMLRNQAFTYLKEAVDEVCARAHAAFQNDEARLNGYRPRFFTLGFVQQTNSAATD